MRWFHSVLSLVLAVSISGCVSSAPGSGEPMSVRELVERRDELLGERVRIVGYLEALTRLTWTISDGHPTPEREGDITCDGVEAPYQFIDVEDENLWTTLPVPSVNVKRSGSMFTITLFPQAVVSGTLEYDSSFGGIGNIRLKRPVFETIGAKFCRQGADDF